MQAKQLMEQFALIANAPQGIQRLREMILQWAVQGKLVPQDPSDEAAAVLLANIQAEKERLIKEGTIKRQKPLPPIHEEEKPFELPNGWEWVRLGDISAYIQRGKSPVYKDRSSFPIISQKCVRWNGLDLNVVKFLDGNSLDSYEAIRFLQVGDLLWNSTGTGTIGRACVIKELKIFPKVVADSHVTVVRTISINVHFLFNWIRSPQVQNYIENIASGTTKQIELNTSTVISHLVPLPPEKEQARIVAKVDALMALCDELEALQQKRAQLQLSTHHAVLESLANAQTPLDLKTAWQRLQAAMPILFTQPQQIKGLRDTILQLAVRGKLVPQDPTDEPAAVLLAKISAEKERLIKQGTIKRQKPLPPIREDEKPFELPQGWEWVRLQDIGEVGRGKSKHRPRNDPSLYKDGNIPFIQTGDVARANGYIKTSSGFYNQKGLDQSRLWFKGTLCITIAANIADTGVLAFDACFPDSVVGFSTLLTETNVFYYEYFIQTAKSRLNEFAPSTAQKNINLEILDKLLIPQPPASELNRIVAKVNSLMALCDELEARLQAARHTQEQFALAAVALS